MTTLETLADILKRDYCVAVDGITPETTLQTLGLDSLSVLELMFKIEDRFKVKITDDPPTDLVTVADVVRFIDELRMRSGTSHGTTPAGISTHT